MSTTRNGELHGLVKRVYNGVLRDHLPSKIGTVNGVQTRKHRLLDVSGEPDYEATAVDALTRHVQTGDHVLVLGGGYGITAVRSAWLGASQVTAVEASASQTRILREAARLNHVGDTVTVHHGIVGPEHRVFGATGDANRLLIPELPDCDVLEMDIEGAELAVLEGLTIRPRAVIVETHAKFDAPTDEVVARLESMGYSVMSVKRVSDGVDTVEAVRDE